MRFEVVNVTPEIAAGFLGKNDGNRKLREHRAAVLARAILEGKWKLTHQPAAISKRGRLLDGQHRFRAVCLANKPVEMVIAYDVPEDVFAILDSGMPRRMFERLRSNAIHTQIVHMMFRLMVGRQVPQEYDIELMLEIFEDALRSYEPRQSKVSKAPIASAIVLRIAMLQKAGDVDGVERIRWIVEKLNHKDLMDIPSIVAHFYRQQHEGVQSDIGVSPITDQFVRAWNAFDPAKEKITKLQIGDHAADIRAARVEFKLVTEGVFD